jgi:predicted transcriptional regulator
VSGPEQNKEEEMNFGLMVAELQKLGVTLERIADELGISDRQVSNIKAGDRPKGETAVKLYLFHMKHRTAVQ